eukprot:scaffold3164_cov112-Isochrysis_galbana.AAC.1
MTTDHLPLDRDRVPCNLGRVSLVLIRHPMCMPSATDSWGLGSGAYRTHFTARCFAAARSGASPSSPPRSSPLAARKHRQQAHT